jgi:hypothetical protein
VPVGINDGSTGTRAIKDLHNHNFPYSFDKLILETKPIVKTGDYKIYQLEDCMNGKKGVI